MFHFIQLQHFESLEFKIIKMKKVFNSKFEIFDLETLFYYLNNQIKIINKVCISLIFSNKTKYKLNI